MIKVLRQRRGSDADTGKPYGLCLALEHTIQLAMSPKLPGPQKKSHYNIRAPGGNYDFLGSKSMQIRGEELYAAFGS